MVTTMKKVSIGLIGFGTVGSGVVKVLTEKKEFLEKKTGLMFNLKYVADIDLVRERSVKIDRSILTSDVNKVLSDPEINIVIELIGGLHPAFEYVTEAIRNRKHVVTANKQLLATHGKEIFDLARAANVSVGFEASVGSGIPIINALQTGITANHIEQICGILNGTTNYILTKIFENNIPFTEALRIAQKLGYAEADPSLDVSGLDTAYKLAILASLAYNSSITYKDVYVEGITNLDEADVIYAKELDKTIKLLAVAKYDGNELELRVHPALISREHIFAQVNDVNNVILLKCDLAGEILFYGPGAGMLSAASAVVSDIINISLSESSSFSLNTTFAEKNIKVKPFSETYLEYYLRANISKIKPSELSDLLNKHQIPVKEIILKENQQEAVILTNLTKEEHIQRFREEFLEKGKLQIIRLF